MSESEFTEFVNFQNNGNGGILNYPRSHALRGNAVQTRPRHESTHSHIKAQKMGRSRFKIHDTTAPHFLTCTIVGWTPLFTRPATVQIILDALTYLQQNDLFKLYGYVILENHLHCIIQTDDLSKEIHSFKSYTARQLIDCLKHYNAIRVLEQLAFHKKRHKIDRDYQVWEEGSHPQLIDNEEVLRQKLDYIHNNPVKRGYVDNPTDWRYSSARNYAGMQGLIPVFSEW